MGSNKALEVRKNDVVAVNRLPANITVSIDITQYRVLKEFQNHFAKFGWTYVLAASQRNYSMKVTSVGCVFGKVLTHNQLLEYSLTLHQISNSGYNTGNVALPLPRALKDILATQACRKAIMFGDSLSVTECQYLLNQLSNTKNPFVCAHGRPTVAPLCNLNWPGADKC